LTVLPDAFVDGLCQIHGFKDAPNVLKKQPCFFNKKIRLFKQDLWPAALLTGRLPLSRATNNAPFVALLNGKDIISPLSANFTKFPKTRHADSERDS
jgi:hypothetical protein